MLCVVHKLTHLFDKWIFLIAEKFEDTKKAERSRNPNGRQYNATKKRKKDKKTNTGRHSTTDKTGVDSCGTAG